MLVSLRRSVHLNQTAVVLQGAHQGLQELGEGPQVQGGRGRAGTHLCGRGIRTAVGKVRDLHKEPKSTQRTAVAAQTALSKYFVINGNSVMDLVGNGALGQSCAAPNRSVMQMGPVTTI